MPRPLPFLVKVLHDVGCGLLFIRATRVVHMDLKAANVVLDWAGPDSRYPSQPLLPHHPTLPHHTTLPYLTHIPCGHISPSPHDERIPLHGEGSLGTVWVRVCVGEV